jgi:di/tricarboxylate transporter
VSDITVLGLILAVVVVLFVWNRIPVEIVALGSALALAATGILPIGDALSGLGDPTVLFIAALFVVSEGLDSSGVTAWAGQRLIETAGESRVRLVVFMSLLVALFTAFISVNGAVAALLPVVVVIAIRKAMPPSQLMMPLAFAAHAGALLVLTGSPVNIIITNVATEVGGVGFGFFEFGLVGVPLLVGAIAIIVFLGPRLLPHRSAKTLPPNLSEHARTLIDHYTIHEPVARLRVPAGNPLVGTSLGDLSLADHPGLSLVGVGASSDHPTGSAVVVAGDAIIVRGSPDAARHFASANALEELPVPVAPEAADSLISRQYGAVEAVVPPRSGLVGQAVFPGMVTESGDLVILAVQRGGIDLGPEEVELVAGDVLLLQGTWDALEEHLEDPDVRVVDPVDIVRRQAVPLGLTSKAALVVLAGMVVLLATGAVTSATAGILAAIAMVLTGVVRVQQAYRAINWTTVILVGAMLPMSTAITVTGAADLIADGLLRAVGDASPYALLVGVFVITAVFGQLISNTATVLVVYPVAVVAALEMGVSYLPVLMALNVAAAAAFLTPVATPVNLMVMGPGSYRFTDYWKFGLPLLLWFMVVAVFLVPVIWPF